MKRKKWLYVGLALTLTGLLAACGSNSSSKDSGSESKGTKSAKQEVTYIELQEMPTADPSLSTDVVSSVMLNNCYETLYRLSPKNEVIPAGAEEEATVSDDGLKYTFKLRKGAKWTTGDPVTAHDYVFSWQRTVDPATKSEYAYMMEPLKNAKEITSGNLDKSELGVKAVSDYELEVELEQPCPYFDYLMAFATFVPQNQKVVEKYGKDYTINSDNAAYNGPFKLVEFDGPGTDTSWAYEKNEQYWDAKNVKLDKINVNVVKEAPTSLNLYQDGQADDVTLTGELAQQMKDDPDLHIEQQGGPYYLELNQIKEDSVYRNVNLRRAIAYSIDRKKLVENIIGDGSQPAEGLTPKGMSFSPDAKKADFADQTKNYIEYNQKKAQEAWKTAQAELGISSLEFDLLGSDDANTKKIMEYIQSAVTQTLSNVKVNVTPVPFSVRLDRSKNGDFDVLLSGWMADYPDPSSFMNIFVTGSSYNRGRYSNPAYDKLVKDAEVTNAMNPEARWQNLIDAENMLMEDMAVIPVHQKAEAHLRNPKFKGIVHHSTGARYDYWDAYLKD